MKKYIVLVEHLPLTIICMALTGYFNSFNLFLFFICIVLGWLLDIDHLFDYLSYKRRHDFHFNLGEFLEGSYFKLSKKIYLPFHSYEISIFLNLIVILSEEFNLIFVSLAHTLHLLQDQLTNKVKPFSYFFAYRALNNFNINAVCK